MIGRSRVTRAGKERIAFQLSHDRITVFLAD